MKKIGKISLVVIIAVAVISAYTYAITSHRNELLARQRVGVAVNYKGKNFLYAYNQENAYIVGIELDDKLDLQNSESKTYADVNTLIKKDKLEDYVEDTFKVVVNDVVVFDDNMKVKSTNMNKETKNRYLETYNQYVAVSTVIKHNGKGYKPDYNNALVRIGTGMDSNFSKEMTRRIVRQLTEMKPTVEDIQKGFIQQNSPVLTCKDEICSISGLDYNYARDQFNRNSNDQMVDSYSIDKSFKKLK